MKVYILTREPFPNGMAATNRIKCYAKAIQMKGVQCEVLVFARSEVYGKPPKNLEGKGLFEGIYYRYIGKTPLRNKNIFVRQINDWLDRVRTKAFFCKHLKKGDVVIGFCTSNIQFINSIINIIHKKGAYYVRELCELPFGTSKETPQKIKLRNISLSKQFPKCDGFIAISDTLVDLAEKHKSPKAIITKIPILVDFAKYAISDKSQGTKIPYIFHSGTLTEQKDGILGVIEAFGIALKKLSTPIMFISTGDKDKSPHKEAINELIDKYHLEKNLVFTGYLSEFELKEYLSKASLVIINKYQTQQNKYCFSTKLAEYMAASKPVIITNVGEAMNWLTNNKDAYIIEPHKPDVLAEKIVEAFSNAQKRYVIAKNGFETCKFSFDYKNYGEKFVNLFTKLSQNAN